VSIKVMSEVWADAEDVSEGTLVVLLAMADWAHDDGTGVFPSQKVLAQKARMKERNLRYCLGRLEDSGYIERIGTRRGGIVEWRILLPVRQSLPRQPSADAPGNTLPTDTSVEPSEELKTPLPPPEGELENLSARAERARHGSKRKRDVQALREVHPKPDWYAWAAEHLPSLPAGLVVIAAGIERRRGATDAELDAEAVRRRVIGQYPHLEETTA
jgi:DNA-binding Lrp family transcriptional regulator